MGLILVFPPLSQSLFLSLAEKESILSGSTHLGKLPETGNLDPGQVSRLKALVVLAVFCFVLFKKKRYEKNPPPLNK